MSNRLRFVLSVLIFVSFALAACGGTGTVAQPAELLASSGVDICEGVVGCTKVTVSERADNSKSALVSGQKSSYVVNFAETYSVLSNTTIDLTEIDYTVVPTIDDCIIVTLSTEGTTSETPVDGTYVFSCP